MTERHHPGMSLDRPDPDAEPTAAGRRVGPAHAMAAGRRWRLLVVGVLVAAVAAVVALLLAQSAGALHLSVLGVVSLAEG